MTKIGTSMRMNSLIANRMPILPLWTTQKSSRCTWISSIRLSTFWINPKLSRWLKITKKWKKKRKKKNTREFNSKCKLKKIEGELQISTTRWKKKENLQVGGQRIISAIASLTKISTRMPSALKSNFKNLQRLKVGNLKNFLKFKKQFQFLKRRIQLYIKKMKFLTQIFNLKLIKRKKQTI